MASSPGWEDETSTGSGTDPLLFKRYRFPTIDPADSREIQEVFTAPTPVSPTLDGDYIRHLADILRRAAVRGEKRGYRVGYDEGQKSGREVGYREGFDHGSGQGHRQGLERAEQEVNSRFDKSLTMMQMLYEELEQLRKHTLKNLGSDLSELVTAVVKQVLGHELSVSRESLDSVIEESLKLLHEVTGLAIHVHPEDRALIEQMSDRFPEQWHIREDAELTPGGCRIETTGSEIDATVEKRLESCLAPVVEELDDR